MIAILKKTVTHFSKSTYSTAKLAELRQEHNITSGLIKIGKTCFGTHWSAAVALEKCLPLIHQLVASNTIQIKVCSFG